jgi:hypothetical protein
MRRDISIITERLHLATDYERGDRIISNKLSPPVPTSRERGPFDVGRQRPGIAIRDRFNKQFRSDVSINGARLANVANKARQRKKGPLVRFGGRVR